MLHDVEVTYSLVIPESHPMIPSSVVESYRIISEGLVRGLRELGLDARMTMPKRSENGRALARKKAVRRLVLMRRLGTK